MRDSSFRKEEPGSVVTEADKEQWRATAKRFLEGDVGADEQQQQPAAKQQKRLNAFYHVCAMDHMLQAIMEGGGLSSFVPQAQETLFTHTHLQICSHTEVKVASSVQG